MKNLKKLFCFTAVFFLVSLATNMNCFATEAKPMDLSNWSSVILAKDRQGPVDPNWKLDDKKTSVTQTLHSKATAFISDVDCINTKIEGSFSVDTLDDDDFIGFVFGYKDVGHYYLFDWKQAGGYDNIFGDSGKQGMSVKVVNTDSAVNEADLWSTSGSENKIKLLYHNNIAYAHKTLYHFALTYTDKGEINIVVKEGTKVIDDITITDKTFQSGKFGFYNFSQEMVTYTGFTIKEIAPVQITGNRALLVITMVTGERKEYEMTMDEINDFITWYNSKAASGPAYMIEKDYNKASFTSRKDYLAYEQISNFEVNEYNK